MYGVNGNTRKKKLRKRKYMKIKSKMIPMGHRIYAIKKCLVPLCP